MSQSPTDATSQQSAEEYLENWNAMGEMISQGVSFSGRERNRCFLNTRSARFADVSAATGLDLIDDGRGIALVDWDHDGDLDLWLSSRTGPRVRMMRNDTEVKNDFLAIRLQGTSCNRDAIGARVEVHLDGPGSQPRKLINTLRAGEGFLSQSGKWLHFGLGQQATVDKVVVRWPGPDLAETFSGITVNRRYRLVQGTGQADGLADRKQLALVPSTAQGTKSTDVSRTVLTQRLAVKKLTYQDFVGVKHELTPAGSSPRLVNLWASWCQPCIGELRQFKRRIGELSGLEIVALSTDHLALSADAGQEGQPGISTARELAAQLQLPFATGIASQEVVESLTALDHNVFYRHLSLPLPCSFLIDGQGKLAAIYKGPVDIYQLIEDLRLLTATRREIEVAASPFPGRGSDYDPSPLGLAAAYLEGEYLQDARAQVLQHINTVASVKDLDQLTALLLEALRPGSPHERTGARPEPSSPGESAEQDAQRNAERKRRIRQGLQLQQRQALIRGYQMLARIARLKQDSAEEIEALRQCVHLQPDNIRSKADLAVALWPSNGQEEAEELLQDVAANQEADGQALVVLGQARMKLRQVDAATRVFRLAVERRPANVEARLNLAIVLQMQGKIDSAAKQYRQILQEDDNHEALNNLAWILATDNDSSIRDGTTAVSLARRLCEATDYREPAYLDTLAAALAEAGDFHEAIRIAKIAMESARGQAQHQLAVDLSRRLRMYTDGIAYRDGQEAGSIP